MDYKKHMRLFGIIAFLGFILFWFSPQFGAVIFLPALGAYFAARKTEADGPSQPNPIAWGIFFLLVGVAVVIRFLLPENFGGFEAPPEQSILAWVYSGALAIAFLIFGYLAYLQRVGRKAR